MHDKRRITLLACVLIAILAFAVYANSMDGKFIWDDGLLIKDNTYIRHWSNIPKIFTSDWGAGAETKYAFYRPLTTLSFLFNYSACKLNVRPYHLTNIILHVLVSLALYWFVFTLFGNRLLSSVAAVLFVAFPTHTETVSYISGRVDALAMLFMLLSFIFYIRYCEKQSLLRSALTFVSYALALLSKENTLIFPTLLLLYHYAFKKKVNLKLFLSILGVTFIYISLRLFVLKSVPLEAPRLNSVLRRLPGFFAAIPIYFGLLLLPFNLHMDYGDRLFGFGDARVIFGIVLLSLLLLYAFKQRNKNGLAFFSVSWFFITLLPVSNLYPIAFYMAEHYLYLPSLGFFLILARGILSLRAGRGIVIAFIAALVGFYSSLTIRQNSYWREPLGFYERTLRFNPDSWRIHHDAATAYHEAGEHKKAYESFRKAVLLKPREILSFIERKIEANPRRKEAHFNLGSAYRILGKTDSAIAAYKGALEIDPGFEDACHSLGTAYIDIGKKDEAIAMFKKVIALNPENADAHNNLAVLYYYTGSPRLAVKHCDRAIELGSEVHPAFLELLGK